MERPPHGFLTGDQFCSFYTNFVHVHCWKQEVAAEVLDCTRPTVRRSMSDGGFNWIHASPNEPRIIPAPAWFLVLCDKMHNATRMNRGHRFTPEEWELMKRCAPPPPSGPARLDPGPNDTPPFPQQ